MHSKSEVAELYATILTHEQILGFDVCVHDLAHTCTYNRYTCMHAQVCIYTCARVSMGATMSFGDTSAPLCVQGKTQRSRGRRRIEKAIERRSKLKAGKETEEGGEGGGEGEHTLC